MIRFLGKRQTKNVGALLCSMGALAGAATITIDATTKFQKISGFGASTAWGSTMPAADADQLWSTTTGAGLSLHRIRIAPDQTTSETNIAKMAIARGATVWATPWTPPSSMKTGETKSGVGGTLSNPSGYAAKLVNFAKMMKDNGVPIYAVSAQNEPDANVDYESCKFDGATMATWVGKSMGPAFAGTGVKVMAPETQNWDGFARFWPAMKGNADFMKYADILATHEYSATLPKLYPEIAAAGKEFWETEIYDTDMPADPGIGSALRVHKLIHQCMTLANMNAWHFWWVYPSTTDNGALWDKATNKASKRLWVMGNFSRFVRPGYIRIGATGTQASGVSMSAYSSEKDGKLVIVAANTNTSAVSQDFKVTGVNPTGVTPWVTDASRNLVAGDKAPVTGSAFNFSLPAKSVTTLVLDYPTTSVSGRTHGALRVVRTSSGTRFALTSRSAGVVQLLSLDGRILASRSFPEGTAEVQVPETKASGIVQARVVQGDRIETSNFVTSR
ncbi:MAG: 1,4-beta-xylanase [Fibrobacterota bacterium]|nr:MAG: 1,4-beta-xylanase [Fibrobacterota bacterium]